jgi:hypothetical protein
LGVSPERAKQADSRVEKIHDQRKDAMKKDEFKNTTGLPDHEIETLARCFLPTSGNTMRPRTAERHLLNNKSFLGGA